MSLRDLWITVSDHLWIPFGSPSHTPNGAFFSKNARWYIRRSPTTVPPVSPWGLRKKALPSPGQALGFLALPELPGRDQERSHSSSQVDR